MLLFHRARVLGAAVAAGLVLAATPAASAVDDTTPPTGSYALLSATSSDQVGPMVVTVWQEQAGDDVSEAGALTREIDWGTGAGFGVWAVGEQTSHAYRELGRHTILVRLTDEAGNRAIIDVGTVLVRDLYAPRVRVRVPASSSADAWSTVTGTIRDLGGSGAAVVVVRAVQLRADGWHTYRGPATGWRHAASKRAALRAAAPVRIRPSGTSWSLRMRGLRAGTLELRVVGRDRAANASLPRVVRRTLTR